MAWVELPQQPEERVAWEELPREPEWQAWPVWRALPREQASQASSYRGPAGVGQAESWRSGPSDRYRRRSRELAWRPG